jgi:site-specific DNA-methyltransferase (adenine-specific)
MRWLCRLVTSPGGVICEPFAGSGTTCIAAALEGFDFRACEREEEYAQIAQARLAHWTGLFALEAAG